MFLTYDSQANTFICLSWIFSKHHRSFHNSVFGYLLLTLPITQSTSTHLLINQKLFIKHLPCARQHFKDRNMVVSKGDKALVLSPHLSVALISPLNVLSRLLLKQATMHCNACLSGQSCVHRSRWTAHYLLTVALGVFLYLPKTMQNGAINFFPASSDGHEELKLW